MKRSHQETSAVVAPAPGSGEGPAVAGPAPQAVQEPTAAAPAAPPRDLSSRRPPAAAAAPVTAAANTTSADDKPTAAGTEDSTKNIRGPQPFANGPVHHGNILRLKMDGPVEAIEGAQEPTGFLVKVPGRRSLEPASPLAARDGRIQTIKVCKREQRRGAQRDLQGERAQLPCQRAWRLARHRARAGRAAAGRGPSPTPGGREAHVTGREPRLRSHGARTHDHGIASRAPNAPTGIGQHVPEDAGTRSLVTRRSRRELAVQADGDAASGPRGSALGDAIHATGSWTRRSPVELQVRPSPASIHATTTEGGAVGRYSSPCAEPSSRSTWTPCAAVRRR